MARMRQSLPTRGRNDHIWYGTTGFGMHRGMCTGLLHTLGAAAMAATPEAPTITVTLRIGLTWLGKIPNVSHGPRPCFRAGPWRAEKSDRSFPPKGRSENKSDLLPRDRPAASAGPVPGV